MHIFLLLTQNFRAHVVEGVGTELVVAPHELDHVEGHASGDECENTVAHAVSGRRECAVLHAWCVCARVRVTVLCAMAWLQSCVIQCRTLNKARAWCGGTHESARCEGAPRAQTYQRF